MNYLIAKYILMHIGKMSELDAINKINTDIAALNEVVPIDKASQIENLQSERKTWIEKANKHKEGKSDEMITVIDAQLIELRK